MYLVLFFLSQYLEAAQYNSWSEINEHLNGVAEERTNLPTEAHGNLYSLNSLIDHIAKNKTTSIKDLVKTLPYELQTNVLVGFDSESLQKASCENFRVVSFSKKALLAFSYNGDKSQYGYEKIEAREFRPNEKRFVYRSIIFEADRQERIRFLKEKYAKNPAQLKIEIAMLYNSEAVVVTEAGNIEYPQMDLRSTQTCLACHTGEKANVDDPRPNWDAYLPKPGIDFDWPGFLGGRDDIVGRPANRGLPLNFDCEEKMQKAVRENERFKLRGLRTLMDPKTWDGKNSTTNNLLYSAWVTRLNELRINRLLNTGSRKQKMMEAFGCGGKSLEIPFLTTGRRKDDIQKVLPRSVLTDPNIASNGNNQNLDETLLALNPDMRPIVKRITQDEQSAAAHSFARTSQARHYPGLFNKVTIEYNKEKCEQLEDILAEKRLFEPKTNPGKR